MPYNPALYFPQSYQPQIYQPQMPPVQPQMQQMPQQPQQMMTPPTIHAEIVQVDGEAAATAYPVGAGASQMMIAKDDSAIYIKSATPNGFTLDVYTRREKPAQAAFDPSQYVRRDEIESLILSAMEKKEAAE